MTDKREGDKRKVAGEGHYDGDDWAFHDELGSFNNEPPPGRMVSAKGLKSLQEMIQLRASGRERPQRLPAVEPPGSESPNDESPGGEDTRANQTEASGD